MAEIKVLRYLMPAFPALALIAASSLYDWLPASRQRNALRFMYAVGVAAVVYVSYAPALLYRAGDMKQLAPIAEAHSPPGQLVYLYTWGRVDYSYNNQLLWYADRFTDLPKPLLAVKGGFEQGDHTVAIMDRDSFKSFPEILGPAFHIQVLGESENFVCFKAMRL